MSQCGPGGCREVCHQFADRCQDAILFVSGQLRTTRMQYGLEFAAIELVDEFGQLVWFTASSVAFYGIHQVQMKCLFC